MESGVYAHDDARLRIEDEEDNGSTHIESPHSQVGEMMDFLKAFPFITMEQYLWELPMRMIKIMSADATQIVYLSDKQQKKYKEMQRHGLNSAGETDDPEVFARALGIPSF